MIEEVAVDNWGWGGLPVPFIACGKLILRGAVAVALHNGQPGDPSPSPAHWQEELAMRNPLWSEERDEMEAEDEILAEEELVDQNLYLCGLLNQVLDRACTATGLPPEFFTAAPGHA